MAQPQILIPYQRGHEYGVGADLASGSPMGLAVKPEHTALEDTPGSTVTFQVYRIASTRDVEEKLKIDAEASYGCGAFGSVSARFDFAKSCQVHSESLFIAISADMTLPFESIDDPELTEHAVELASDATRFKERFGTMFVRGIERGGLFVAVLQIETSSAKEASEINVELEGSYGLFSAAGATNIQKAVDQHNASAHMQLHFEGGDEEKLAGFLSAPFDPQRLLDATTLWLQTVRELPVPYQVTLAPLVIARGGPPPPNAPQLQFAQDVLIHCAQLRSILLDGLNTVTYVAGHPDLYRVAVAEGDGALGALQTRFAKALDLVADSARDAVRDAAAAKMPEEYFSAEGLEMPVIPAGLYSAVSDEMVKVPDLGHAGSWATCLTSLQAAGLSAQRVVDTTAPPGAFKVLSTLPAAGTKVVKGSPVEVRCPPPPPIDKSAVGIDFAPPGGLEVSVPHG